MAINDNDLFLVNTSNQAKTVKKSELMTKPSDNDYMLVNKASDNKTYKVKFSEVKTELNPTSPPVIGSVALSEDNPGGDRFTGQAFTTDIVMTVPGSPTAPLSVKAKLQARLLDKSETSTISTSSTENGWQSTPLAGVDNFSYLDIAWSETHQMYGAIGTCLVGGSIAGMTAYSPDGINWTSNGKPAGLPANNYYLIATAGGFWVVLAEDARGASYVTQFSYSETSNLSNGWNPVGAAAPNQKYVGLCAGVGSNGQDVFLAVASANNEPEYNFKPVIYANSPNTTWASLMAGEGGLPNPFIATCCCFANGKFVIIGYTNGIGISVTSTDGANWTQGTEFEYYQTLPNKVYGGNGFFIAGGQGYCWRSDDGLSWVQLPNAEFGTYRYVNWGIGSSSETHTVAFGVDVGNSSPQLGSSQNGFEWYFQTGNDGIRQDSPGTAYSPSLKRFASVGKVNGSTQIQAQYSDYGNFGSITKITLADNTDLDQFTPGGSATQSNNTISGTTWFADPANNLLYTVEDTQSSWTNGKKITGPPGPLETSKITSVVTNSPAAWNTSSGLVGGDGALAYGNGKYVAVNEGGNIEFSADAITWSMATVSGTTQPLHAVAFGNGRFVATGIGGPGKALVSTDGIDWTPYSMPANSYRSLAYSPELDRWVAVHSVTQSPLTQIAYSDDGGETWTTSSGANGFNADLMSIAWGNGHFVAVSRSQYALISTDGIVWTGHSMPQPPYFTSVAYGEVAGTPTFLAVASGGGRFAAYSIDNGMNWTQSKTGDPMTDSYKTVYHAQGAFWAYNDNNPAEPVYTTNLVSWHRTAQLPDTSNGNIAGFGNGLHVIANGGQVRFSSSASNPLTTLTFADDSSLANLSVGDYVHGSTGNVIGFVASIDVPGKSITVINSEGTWLANNEMKVVGPVVESIDEKTLYALLDANLDVQDLQTADPGYLSCTTAARITFPAVLPDGQSPDTTLLAGTSIQTEIYADNLAFQDTKNSNIIVPSGSTALGFDSKDPAQVAAFQVVKESLETYEQERDTRRSSFAQAMRNANFSQEQIESVGLE